jgi:Type IV secretion system pilin
MKRKITNILLSFAAVAVFGLAPVVVATDAYAAPSTFADAVGDAKSGVNKINDGNTTNLPQFIKSIINILLFVIGIIAVLMIIIGGIRYVVSGGDSSAVTGAKNTILYSIVGLVVALMAFAIVNFVLNSL